MISFKFSSTKAGNYEQISFSGNSIRLLELKREIVERKKLSSALSFDLEITDDTGKGKLRPLSAK